MDPMIDAEAAEPAVDDQEQMAPDGVDDQSQVEPPTMDLPLSVVEEYPPVGDDRRLRAYALSLNYMEEHLVGEAWQSEDGKLHGLGVFKLALFEPEVALMYRKMANHLDISPLSVLMSRWSHSQFVTLKLEDADD